MSLTHRIAVAAGKAPADLVLANARVVSVLADRIVKTNVAIADGVIAGFGEYKAHKTIDVQGRYLSSGLIDSHLHIESTLLTPAEFARVVVPRGTTTVVADPHEIANVMGEKGVRWMLAASEGLPLDVELTLPSCVPASRFESSAVQLTAAKLARLSKLSRIIGIGEVMDFPGVIAGRPDLLAKIRLIPGMRVDGHAPGLMGKELYAYVAAGIHSDHEAITADEARERLMAGLHLMLREGTSAKNVEALLQAVTPANSHRCFFCTDDRSARDLIEEGHIDEILRRAVRAGVAPMTALQMATNNAPYYFRLARRKGAVAVGYVADLVVFEDLKSFRAQMVFKEGKLVARDGKLLVPCTAKRIGGCTRSVRIADLSIDRLRIPLSRPRKARVIDLIPEQIVTRETIVSVRPHEGELRSDPSRDLVKLALIERHHASGRIGVGLVRGLGLAHGAIATTISHDAHNLMVAGVDDRDMMVAVKALQKCGGGIAVAAGGKVKALLTLPIAGLMSDQPAARVAADYAQLCQVAHELKATPEDPFLILSFLALSVIPELKLTDRGLLDVRAGRLVPLLV